MAYRELGQLIKGARERRAWDQAQLARAVGVKQQTVSRWEAGTSRPQEPVLRTLIELFGSAGQAATWFAAGGYATQRESVGTGEPGRPLTPTLPLDRLAPKTFEEFCRDLLKYLHPTAEVHGFGTQGHDQSGIDGYVRQTDGSIWTFQCKRVRQFGPVMIQSVVEKTEIPAARHFLLLARPATPDARKKVEEYQGWTLWDKEDLSRAVRHDIPRESSSRLVDTYFPGLREQFLGAPAPGPWMTAEDMFRPFLSRSRTFNHTWPYVGQADAVRELQVFAEADDIPVGILVGTAGSGKSYTLLHLARALEGALKFRFASLAAMIEPKDLESLPQGKIVVVVDDAHDRRDINTLVKSASYIRPQAKILIATRPYALTRINTNIRLTVNTEPRIIHLDPLSSDDIDSLAGQILHDSDMNASLARKVVAVADGSPLVAVIGATLVAKKQLQPELLDHQSEFRQQLLARFQDVILGDFVEPAYRELLKETLQLLAAVQPVSTTDQHFRALAERVVGQPYDRISKQIRALEDSGILLRRGNFTRIVPDVLGDHVLEIASFDGDESTGYCDRVFDLAEGEYADNLIVNVGKLDWRLSLGRGVAPGLLRAIWAQLAAQFLTADASGRQRLIKRVTEVAYYQPREVFELARFVIDNPTNAVEKEHRLLGLVERDPVQDSLPAALRNVAYTLECMPDACDLLWTMARTAGPDVRSKQDHPIRVLTTIASYRENVPDVVYTRLVDRVMTWLADPNTATHPFSPFDVIDTLLATTGTHTESTGEQLLLRQFRINVDAVRHIRERVLNAAFTELTSSNLPRALRAIKTIELGITYPSGAFDNQPPLREPWTPEILAVLDRLRDVVREYPLDPILVAEIRHALKWHTGFWSGETHHAACTVVNAMPDSVVHRVCLALTGAEFSVFREPGDSRDEARERWHRWQNSLVAVLREEYEPSALVRLLEEQLVRTELLNGVRQPDALLHAVLSEDPDLSKIVIQRALASAESPWRGWVHFALSAVTAGNPDEGVDAARRLLSTVDADAVLYREVVWAYAWGRGTKQGVSPEEFELLRLLAEQSDVTVRAGVAQAVDHIMESDRHRALELLMAISFGDSAAVADEVLSRFHVDAAPGLPPQTGPNSRSGFSWRELSDVDRGRILEQLRLAPSISKYHVQAFLALLSVESPLEALSVLCDRIGQSLESTGAGYGSYLPIPLEWSEQSSLRFRDTQEFEAIVRHLRDWSKSLVEVPRRLEYAAVLFRAVIGEFDPIVMSILGEWMDTPTRDEVLTVAALFGQSPRRTVWDHWNIAAQLLNDAWGHGPDTYGQVANELYGALIRGPRVREFGKPIPGDIENRDLARSHAADLQVGSPAQQFFADVAESAERRIRRRSPSRE